MNEFVELETALPVDDTVIVFIGVLRPCSLISTFSPALNPRNEMPMVAPGVPEDGTIVRLGCTVYVREAFRPLETPRATMRWLPSGEAGIAKLVAARPFWSDATVTMVVGKFGDL